jgi:hypothetical protein
MPRFVILEHTGTATYKPGRHWDLMLEAGDRLRTWELAGIPTERNPVKAIPLPDHRIAYLDFEGELSDSRGAVRQWDAGGYKVLREDDGVLMLVISGGRLRGRLHLEQLQSEGWTATLIGAAGGEA